MLAGNQPRQVAALLLVGAEAPQLVDAEIGMRAVGEADGARDAADLFHGDDVLEVAEAEAAVFLGHGHAEQAHFPEFGPEFARKAVAAVDLVGDRRNAAQGELADGLAQLVDARTQLEVEIDGKHAASGRWSRLAESHHIVRQSDRQVPDLEG